MSRLLATLIVLGTAFSLGGCVAACRPGHIGPYGGIHPGRCVVY